MTKEYDLYKYPRNYFLNITGLCNLSCTYCSSADFNPSQSMSKEQLKLIIEQLKELGVFNIIISGGEPLVHPDFEWVINSFSEFSALSLNTNGTLIDKHMDFFNGFPYKKRLSINISLDSLLAENNAKTRGAYDVKHVIENANILDKFGYKVTILCTITENITERDLDAFLSFSNENPTIDISYNDLKPNGRAEANWKHLVPTIKTIHMINKKLDNLFLNYDYIHSNNNEELATLLTCGAGKQCLAISETGDVFPCTAMYIKIGNIFKTSIREICDDSVKLKQVNNLRNEKLDKIKECSECEYNRDCSGGCRALVYSVTENLYGVDPYCWHKGKFYEGV